MNSCLRHSVGALMAAASLAGSAAAQEVTPDPNEWRSVVYSDLQLPGPDSISYAEIWADHLAQNNKTYKDAGDIRFATGNAPATEAHFVVRSPVKVAILTVLNTATACKILKTDDVSKTTLKECPMRLAIYEAGKLSVNDAGRGCYLEFVAGLYSPDPARSASYAAYDVENRTIRTGVIFAKEAVDRCLLKIVVPAT